MPKKAKVSKKSVSRASKPSRTQPSRVTSVRETGRQIMANSGIPIASGLANLGRFGKGKVGNVFPPKRKNARQMLKKAYEKRARYLIRTGQLGKARKTLIKKRGF